MTDASGETLRAGWLLQYRLHGLPPSGTGYSMTFALPGSTVEVAIEFLMKSPTFPAKVISGPRSVPPGTTSHLKVVDRPVDDRYTAPYTWLTIMATELFPASPALDLTNTEGRKNALIQVSPRLAPTRDRTFFIASLFATFFRPAIFEAWIQQSVLRYDDIGVYTEVRADPITYPPSIHFEIEHLRAYLSTLAGLQGSTSIIMPLLAAGKWLVEARGYMGDSTRFFTYYRVVETLAHAEARDAVRQEAFQITSTLSRVETLLSSGPVDFSTFFAMLKYRVREMPIVDKFSLLAHALFPAGASADIELFRVMNKARNRIVHGRTDELPREIGGVNMLEAAETLAHRYLIASCARIVGPSPKQLKFSGKPNKPTVVSVYYGVLWEVLRPQAS